MTALHKAAHKAPTLPLPLRGRREVVCSKFVQVSAEFVQMFVHSSANQPAFRLHTRCDRYTRARLLGDSHVST